MFGWELRLIFFVCIFKLNVGVCMVCVCVCGGSGGATACFNNFVCVWMV